MLGCLLRGNVAFAREYSPYVEQISEDEILIELSSNWQTEMRRIRDALPETAQLGVGRTRLVARLAALSNRIVLPGTEAVFLEPFPLSLLPLDEESLRRLHLLGFEAMGDVAHLSKGDLYLQFGAEGARLFDWVHGQDEEGVQRERESASLLLSCDLEHPALLEGALLELLTQAFAQMRGTLACAITLTLLLDGAEPLVVALRFAKPLKDPQGAFKLLRLRLERMTLLAPPTGLHLEVTEQKIAASALDLFERRSFKEKRNRLLNTAPPGIKATLLMQLVWDDAAHRLPERRAHLQSLVRSSVTRPLYQPKQCRVVVHHVAADRALQPKAVEGRGVSSLLQVWDIEEEWWSKRPIHRTYYDTVLESGQHKRLFYDHLSKRWYTH